MANGLPSWFTALAAIIAGLGGLAGMAALINAIVGAGSKGVEHLHGVIDRLDSEITRLDTRVKSLEEQGRRQANRISDLECEVRKWKQKYQDLCRWVESELGLEPFQDITSD